MYNQAMEITNEQYQKIAKYLPVQRGNVKISNRGLINAVRSGEWSGGLYQKNMATGIQSMCV